jgi:hypothetical protein
MKQAHTTHARPRLSDNDELDGTSADMGLTGAQAERMLQASVLPTDYILN